VADMV
jgi:hypothetical protein